MEGLSPDIMMSCQDLTDMQMRYIHCAGDFTHRAGALFDK